jgi:hypothetical protein
MQAAYCFYTELGYNFIIMAKFFLTMLLAAFLVSCDLFLDLNTLEADEFYALDFTKNKHYTVKAEMLAQSEECVIWVEKGSGVNKIKAKEIADMYDKTIRPRIAGAFGMKDITVEGETTQHFDDILDYANSLAGKNNRKLTVLLLDIKDGFDNKTKLSYVAGYFDSGNFYERGYGGYSNGCDMIYVDTYPSLDPKLVPDTDKTYATFAHELQHLINYATTRYMNRRPMDTWIDEGLSSQAEHIYFDGNLKDKCKWFSDDKYGTIANGNNFFVWDNHPEESMAILDDYATVYMFFRWLYLQADSELKSGIFLDIETSNLSDHSIITSVAQRIRPEWADWDTLFRSWLAANYYPANTDYGYKGDSYFQGEIKVKAITKTEISLYPGEGAYSIINNFFTPPVNGTTNIRYAGFDSKSSGIKTQAPYTSEVLLTYNANTNNSKSTASETGSLTGVSSSASPPPNSRMAVEATQTETHTGPYVIDARDFPGRFGRNK